MTVKEIYDLAVKMGIENDLRGKQNVLKNLERVREKFKRMKKDKKEVYDLEKLENPYSDSRILNESKKTKKIKKVLVGVDIEGDELLLADKLGIDLVIGHHPRGKGLANLSDVMHLQAEVFYLSKAHNW